MRGNVDNIIFQAGIINVTYKFTRKQRKKEGNIYDRPCPNLLWGDKVLILFPLLVSRDSFRHPTWAHFQIHALERTQLVKITVREFLDDILNTNSMHIIVRWKGTYNVLMRQASAFKLNFYRLWCTKYFLDDILNTNSMHIIVRWKGTYNVLMRQASALKIELLSFMMYTIFSYSSHGAPCPARDLFPWLNTRV